MDSIYLVFTMKYKSYIITTFKSCFMVYLFLQGSGMKDCFFFGLIDKYYSNMLLSWYGTCTPVYFNLLSPCSRTNSNNVKQIC